MNICMILNEGAENHESDGREAGLKEEEGLLVRVVTKY
jgi:hypothetical protein